MKTVVFLCCLTATALAVGEKQLQLDDIERDNLVNERKIIQEKQSVSKYVLPSPSSTPQTILSPAKFEYGFTPIKTPQKYVQVPQNFQYVYPQYTTQLAYTPLQYQYQQYDNSPYVVGNHLVQNAQDQQQYYNQQYVYVQPFTASSSSIQMVVDLKGNVKYFAYVPTQYFRNGDDAIKNSQVQTIPANHNNVGPQIFTQEPDYRQLAKSESQYITQPQLPPQPVTQQLQYVQPTQQPILATQFVQPTQQSILRTQFVQPTQQSIIRTQFVPTDEPIAKSQLAQPTQESFAKSLYTQKGEPQSLLDSYVPSILQLQYLKQQQETEANAIRESPKTVVPRTVLTKQSPRISSSGSENAYSLPSPYRTRAFKI